MGFSQSKIPETTPGQILKLVGLPDIDKAYEDLEDFVKDVDHIRTEVDLRFTDFIKSLGASKLWEIYNQLSEILRMYILVLAINLKDEIIRIEYDELVRPYIIVNKKHFPYSVRRLISNFEDYTFALTDAREKLREIVTSDRIRGVNKLKFEIEDYQDELDTENQLLAAESIRVDVDNSKSREVINNIQQIKINVNTIYKNSVRLLQRENYNTADMISAIERIDENNKTIIKACESIDIYSGLEASFRSVLTVVYQDAKGAQRKDKMIQQIAHAVNEKILSPSEIVKFFWPYPDH